MEDVIFDDPVRKSNFNSIKLPVNNIIMWKMPNCHIAKRTSINDNRNLKILNCVKTILNELEIEETSENMIVEKIIICLKGNQKISLNKIRAYVIAITFSLKKELNQSLTFKEFIKKLKFKVPFRTIMKAISEIRTEKYSSIISIQNIISCLNEIFIKLNFYFEENSYYNSLENAREVSLKLKIEEALSLPNSENSLLNNSFCRFSKLFNLKMDLNKIKNECLDRIHNNKIEIVQSSSLNAYIASLIKKSCEHLNLDLVSIKDLAEICNCSSSTIYKYYNLISIPSDSEIVSTKSSS